MPHNDVSEKYEKKHSWWNNKGKRAEGKTAGRLGVKSAVRRLFLYCNTTAAIFELFI